LSFIEARSCVIEQVTKARARAPVEEVPLSEAAGRVLAEDISADRDYPPLARSIRDGFAVRAADLPGSLDVIGEIRAGDVSAYAVERGQAVEIMTGAPMPEGADAVVMVEHTVRNGASMRTERAPKPGEFVNPRGSEARAGEVLLQAGKRLDFADIALLAMVGHNCTRVYARPRVAIVATGDEIVEVWETPGGHQVRNSNAQSLAAQVLEAGGIPEILPIARDVYASTHELVEQGLSRDLLLLSGGVSAGKYDIVEQVLADLGAEFFFDRVLIQPGQPLVFGRATNAFFFGLPGNPASTMVTFRVFARAAVELLGGGSGTALGVLLARLTCEFRHKPGLTRFLPARLSGDGAMITPEPWQGSSDVPALARANAFLVAHSEREHWSAGELIEVLPK
jgi:molybdopterin molybdotransferase